MYTAELKQRARAQLGGRIFGETWLIALLVHLLYTAVLSGVGTIAAGIGSVIVSGPMSYGLAYMFSRQARTGAPLNIADLFRGFTDDFVQTFLIGLMSGLFTALWSLLFVIPGIVKAYSYALVYFVKADNPSYGWRECLRESTALMRGNRMRLFMLDLSFIGWYFVGALCLGVGTLWVAPYHFAAKTHFYESLKWGREYSGPEYPAY